MILSICHQLSNSQMYHWKIVVRLSNPVDFSCTDQRITIFMACVCWRGNTDTNHKAFDWSFWNAKTKYSHQSSTVCLSLSLSASLAEGLSPLALWLSNAHLLLPYTRYYWANLLQIFSLWRSNGNSIVLTKPPGLLSGSSVLVVWGFFLDLILRHNTDLSHPDNLKCVREQSPWLWLVSHRRFKVLKQNLWNLLQCTLKPPHSMNPE